MAKNSDNLFTEGFRGTVGGNMTFRRKKSGKVVVSKKRGSSKKPLTADQVTTNNRFKRAIKFAKSIIKDAASKLMYDNAAVGDQSGYNVAVRDSFTAPEVTRIDVSNYKGLSDDRIYIEATDDFKVTAVKVSIHNPTGELVEAGDAVLEIDGLHWLYTPTMENERAIGSKIKATAYDNANNEHSLEITV